MRIAEDLLLLLTDDESGRLVTSAQHVDAALAGATVLELALAGRVALTGESDAGRPAASGWWTLPAPGTRCWTTPSASWLLVRAASRLRSWGPWARTSGR